jgi:membrane protein
VLPVSSSARPVCSSSSKTPSTRWGKSLRNQATASWIRFGTTLYPAPWYSGSVFFLLVSLLLTAGVSAVGLFLGSAVPGSQAIWRLADFGLSFCLVTLLFAGIFKILPDVRLPWGDVWPGAILTALLFTVAQVVMSVIIRLANPGLAFGAAGALVVILVWVDMVSLILLFGAEFVRVYSRRFGSGAQPKEYAEALTEDARAAQGIPAQESTSAAVLNKAAAPVSGSRACSPNTDNRSNHWLTNKSASR